MKAPRSAGLGSDLPGLDQAMSRLRSEGDRCVGSK